MKLIQAVLAGVCALAVSAPTSLSSAAVAPDDPRTIVQTSDLAIPGGAHGGFAASADREAIDAWQIGEVGVMGQLGGIEVAVELTKRVENAQRRYVLVGNVVGDPLGSMVLAVHGEAMAAEVRTDGRLFRIRTAAPGIEIVEEIDEAGQLTCGIGPEHTPVIEDDGAVSGGDCDDGSVIDVLFVYTPISRISSGGHDNMGAIIDMMIASTNETWINSGVNATANVVYATEVPYNENADHLSILTNPNDGFIDEVHDLRDIYGADAVAMLVTNAGYCGVAYLMGVNSPGFAANAFSVTVWTCASLVFTHELGHNQGCCHAPGDGGGCFSGGLYPYSVGYRYNGNSGQLWRTVMAYSPGTRIPYMSNPAVSFDGQPTGVESNLPDGADNVATINDTRLTFSNFRCNDMICEGLDLPSMPMLATDCNDNLIPDDCEVALGIGEDDNNTDIIDDCERPSNDRCVAAELTFDGLLPFTTDIALQESGPADCGAFERDVWIRYVPKCTGTAVINVCDADFAPQVAVYSACPDAGGELLACAGSPCVGGSDPLTLAVTPGVYLVRIGGADDQTYGSGVLSVNCSADCVGDFDASGDVGVTDLQQMLSAWGTDSAAHDIAPDGGDGVVDVSDLFVLLGLWGLCP